VGRIKAISISVPRGLQYQCPRCKKGCPVTRAFLSLDRVTVEAVCEPCRMAIAREFLLAGRSNRELMDLSFLGRPAGDEEYESWEALKARLAR
jgi:hypothetical protein